MNINTILKKLRYESNEIEEIINTYNLKEYEEEQENKLETLFIKLSYKDSEYQKIVNKYPLNDLKEQTLYYKVIEIYFYFLKLDLSNLNIIKITKTMPTLFSYALEKTERKIEALINLGYTEEQVLKMIISAPELCNLSIENIMDKINCLIRVGYTKKDVLKMIFTFPSLLSISIESITNKINDLMSLGYTKEEVLKMTTELPTLFGLSIENIKEKIKFYDEVGLHEVAVLSPKYLMQSISLSYARYMFLKDKGVTIDMSNYKKLFYGQKPFESHYGISKKELLSMYNYEEYKEKENEQKLQLKLN